MSDVVLDRLKEIYEENMVTILVADKIAHLENVTGFLTTVCALVFPINDGIVVVDDEEITLHKGQVLLISNGIKLAFRLLDENFIHINLFFRAYSFKGYTVIDLKDDRVIGLVNESINEYCKPKSDDLKIRMLLNQVLTSVIYYDDKNNSDMDIFNQAIRYISKQYRTEITLKELCQEFNIKESRISYIFKKYSGKRPIDYVIDYKMKIATRLLQGKKIKIKNVSSYLGYEDPYYFSRLFKKRIGISPSEFMKNSLGKDSQ